MAVPDLNDVKVIVRSILTSYPGIPNISQVLKDFRNLEGYPLPYREYGFETVFELLKTMNDVIKIPCNPNMDSPIKLILDQKSIHIRELVVNQKKKTHKNSFKKRSNYVDSRVASDFRHNMYPSNYNARGYNYVRKNPSSLSKSKGKVTEKLQSFIEYLCNSSESKSISIYKLKTCLITHPDYEQLGVTNVESAINMLKYFIYIDKGGVHLKESFNKIFSSNKHDIRNNSKSKCSLQSVVDEEEEISNFNMNYYDFGLTQDFLSSCKNSSKPNVNNLLLKNSDSINQEKEENTLKAASVLRDKPLNNKIDLKIGSQINGESKISLPNFLEKSKIDYKSAIVSIIASSQTPITVQEVLERFKRIHGYSFPFEKLSCRSCMDFFRLYPALFKLNNQFSTSSYVTLDKIEKTTRKIYYRKNFIKSSILYNQTYLINWNVKYILESNDSSSTPKIENHQEPVKNIENTLESIDMDGKIYDSEMVKESMKDKMRNILIKYDKGILCNEFMDIYAKEYHSQFTFYEYGFKSMKDMAYKLPSVFYVKVTGDECILFHACKQNELKNENNLSDPSQYYKNIPKTILHNLSLFFENHSGGVQFDDVKTLYCSQFGKCYEPLKYGYSSERHMFESLNKMVEIRNNIVFTKDPFAYTYFLKHEETINNNSYDVPVLVCNNFLMDYSGKDICNGKFVYPPFPLGSQKMMTVVVAEIYNPSSFYIQIASQVKTLEIFMKNLQEIYCKYGDQYRVSPELIFPGLVCTTCFEHGEQWHRALVLNVVDDNYVSVLYVDYGSIETVTKSSIRLLKSEFGNLPIQSLHCSLYENRNQLHNYSREINEYFAKLIDGKILEANFKHFINKDADKRMVVTLCLPLKNGIININKQCSSEIKKQANKCEESIRRTITVFLQDDEIHN